MAINKFATEYIIEIQNNEKSDGILCCERVVVKVCEEGGGTFLAIKTENLEPTDEYDNYTVTLSAQDVQGLLKTFESILQDFVA